MGTTQLESVPEPKYWHLKTVISEALDSEFEVGQILPNERELAARFGVARATLRQALEQLELEGRLQRRRGVGTTVAPPRVGVDVSTARHHWPAAGDDSWQAVDCSVTAPPPAVAGLLDCEGDDARAVYAIRRLRATHGQSVAAEQLYVPAASVPALVTSGSTTGEALARGVLRELQRLPWTARTGPSNWAPPAPTTPRSSTGCRARPSSSSRPATSPPGAPPRCPSPPTAPTPAG